MGWTRTAAAGGVLVLAVGCGGGVPESVRQDAEAGAQYYCSFYGYPLHSDEFANCVEQETEVRIERWRNSQ